MMPIKSGFMVCLALWGLAAAAVCEEEKSWFCNVAENAGLTQVAAQRAVFVELDGDGYPDCVLASLWKEKRFTFFLSRPGEHGRRFEEAAGLIPLAATPNLLLFSDLDNDGDMDAFAGMYCDFEKPDYEGPKDLRSAVYLNDGGGAFTLVEGSGVDGHPATTCAATFVDFDNDGCLDLFVGNWYREYGESYRCYPDRLYRGQGNGAFVEVTAAAGMLNRDGWGDHTSAKPVYGAAHCDFDNDGWQDILVCTYGRQWNFLWRNLGNGCFDEVGDLTGFDGDGIRHGRYPEWLNERLKSQDREPRENEQPFRANGNTFSVASADYDCDGDIDLFLGEITHGWAGEASDLSSLLINQGEKGGFVFERHRSAIPREHQEPQFWNQGDMHVTWLDFDNDTRLDLLISSGDYPDGQYLRLFRQEKDHGFTDVTEQAGFDWESSSGISVVDYDRDGDLDILAGKSWFRLPKERCLGDHPAPALFRNEVNNGNHWLNIRLHGKAGCNRRGVGARIEVQTGELRQLREIQGGSGHCGQFNPQEAHFGLGEVEVIDKITVRWPDQAHTVQVLENVKVDRFVEIVQGEGLRDY